MATKKLDKEHLEQISDLRKKFADNAMILGNLSIEEFMHTKCWNIYRSIGLPVYTYIYNKLIKEYKNGRKNCLTRCIYE